jgi:cell pole-organizing protein PopZ
VPSPEPAKASREPSRPPLFEALRSEAAKAELARLELARSEFARAEAAKSDFVRPDSARADLAGPDLARPDLPKPELPMFDPPRRDAPRWEAARPESQEPMRQEPVRPPAPPPVLRAADEGGLLSPHTTAAVDLAFNTLAQTVLVQNSRTLEDLVREMLKPMLKAWLDDNLPGLVERLVRAEIERVSRGRS